MRVLRGVPASGGAGVWPLVVVSDEPPPAGGPVRPGEEVAEIERFRAAAAATAADYEALAGRLRDAGDDDEADIASAQGAMAVDPTLAGAVRQHVRSGANAVDAALRASRELAADLRALEDELLAARAVDLEDVGARVARRLSGRRPDPAPRLSRPSAVAARDLAASVAATMPRHLLRAIVLEAGSPTAHAAILARTWGIPAVVGVGGLLEALDEVRVRDGGSAIELAIDGATGEVVVGPDAATRERMARAERLAREAARRERDDAGEPAVTRDGTEVVLLANLGSPDEAAAARAAGARGVGLFRTEFLFLERAEPPGEDEQVAAYRQVVEAFAPDPVTIRLLDVGGDKPIPYLSLPEETNPFLGVRALRLAATHGALFEAQLRAAMRAAVAGTVRVLAPMIADAEDVASLLALAERARGQLEADGMDRGRVALGVMLEIPSAVVLADRLLPSVEFASLGTNDLLQYTLAADRGNAGLARFHDPIHPAHLSLVRSSVAAARAAGVELSVCGEMAGDPLGALVLVGLGIRSLSMAAGSLGRVRHAIRAADLAMLESAASAAASAGSAREARAALAGVVRA